KMSFPRLDRALERGAIHPGHHQHSSGRSFLDDCWKQTIRVEFQFIVTAHKQGLIAHQAGPWLKRFFRPGACQGAQVWRKFLRACLKIPWGPAARDFGGGQGGEAGASPQRAVTVEPTQATAKRSAARRVFAQKARWLRCSSVTGR